MTSHSEKIENLKTEAKSDLESVSTSEQLDDWRIKYIGRKGAVPLILRGVKDLPVEEKRIVGKAANELRIELEEAFTKTSDELLQSSDEQKVATPDNEPQELPEGHLHPLTLTTRRIQEIFSALGFVSVEGPEVEEAKYNFDQLNIPLEHPARAETDTFYIKNLPELVLRTHVSSLQARGVLENHLEPPIKIFYEGRTFRSEKPDATHETTFNQFEFMSIGKDVNVAELKGVISTFYSTFFQRDDIKIRFRPAYFPFVEPGFEVDSSCIFCSAKGCSVCKQTGWIELAGAGMVHPNVLRHLNIDPDTYRGFACGGAVDRLAMLVHNIDDIRLFWSGDISFLKQFS